MRLKTFEKYVKSSTLIMVAIDLSISETLYVRANKKDVSELVKYMKRNGINAISASIAKKSNVLYIGN